MPPAFVITRRGFLLLLTPALLLPLQAETSKAVRLLTIGNSFSANATRHLKDLAKAGGHELIHKSIVVGGSPLQLHAEKAQLNEKNPKDPKGLYSDGTSLKQLLQSQPWDFVTIQQASIKSHDLSTYQPYANQLRDLVAKHAPAAKLLVHQTWAYRSDDPRFDPAKSKPGEPPTQAAMYQALTHAYRTVAAELKAPLIPVGDAFFMVDSDPKWAYQRDEAFKVKQARHPALPNQKHSLHVGWKWWKQKDGSMVLRMDGHHANTAGEYLGGCVWYEALFGVSVVGNPFVPSGLQPEFARFLQETAHRAMEAEKERSPFHGTSGAQAKPPSK